MFRRNDTYVVWDERGLTVRDGPWSFNTRLEGLPVSPKLQSREQIQETVALNKRGIRNLQARAISGMRRLGTKAYVLVRWDDRDRKPWMEALVSVDLTAPKPKPKLEGQFAGLSIAREPIDDRLMLEDDQLVVPVNTDEGWGLGMFDPERQAFEFSLLGDTLVSYSPRKEGALFVEQTAYGAAMAGTLVNGGKGILFQTRGAMRFLDDQKPELMIATTATGRLLYWSDTGTEMKIGPQDEIRRAGKYILTWSPPANPTRASLYDPARWELVATWARS
jgi:hypothetical protein